jgi:hypothetical protein
MGCGGHIHGGGLSGGAPGPRSRAPSMPAKRWITRWSASLTAQQRDKRSGRSNFQ